MSRIALALAWSRSRAFLYIVNHRNLCDDIPNAHFKGFILRLYFLHRRNAFLRSSTC